MRLLSKLSIELVSVFKEASGNFIFIFSLTRQRKNLKTFCACTESPDLIYGFSRNDSSGDPIPLMQLFLSIDLSLTIFARQSDGPEILYTFNASPSRLE
jgi:hypothetical protein